MFNNLNPANNQAHSAVDDIFAETDKPADNSPTNLHSSSQAASAIDTHKVGLASAENVSEELSAAVGDNKWFKIVLGIIIVAILLLGGYLIYQNFFAPKTNSSDQTAQTTATKKVATSSNANSATEKSGSFVTPSGGSNQPPADNPAPVVPIIPGVNAPATNLDNSLNASGAPTSSAVITPVNTTIDSDGDGLTDAEEKIAGTNINIIDTDGDGLSDYEEVKIYHTNPLNADTDGDGYLDGEEVKNGFNPNGPGKMPKTATTTSKTASTSPLKK